MVLVRNSIGSVVIKNLRHQRHRSSESESRLWLVSDGKKMLPEVNKVLYLTPGKRDAISDPHHLYRTTLGTVLI